MFKTLPFFILLIFIFTGCENQDPLLTGERKSEKERIESSGQPIQVINNIQEKEKSKSREIPLSTTLKKAERKKVKARPIQSTVRDTSINTRIRKLKQLNADIDLTDPASRKWLFSGTENIGVYPFTIISREQFLRINFDNDILDNTDHFYTNGIRIEYVGHQVSQIPLKYLMLPYWGTGTNYYGIGIVQNMYTPSTTKSLVNMSGDRPYAAYLCLTYFKISNDPVKKTRFSSELDLGVIGPSSGGDFVQTTFHSAVPTNNEPVGWEYQIQDDLVVNYNVMIEKGIVSMRTFDLNLNGAGSLGTLYSNLSGGLSLRAGLINPYFSRLWVTPASVNKAAGLRNVEIYFFMKMNGSVVGYDATLQGGVFNHSSAYTISSGDISRFMFNGSAGMTISVGGFRIDAEQFIISPEFQNGWWHKWVHFGLTFCL